VLGMVETRLFELDASARRVLRAASVFGATFTPAGVQALLGEGASAEEIARQLRDLREREIVQRPTSRKRSDDEHGFRHALYREAAYAMLTEQDRTLAH